MTGKDQLINAMMNHVVAECKTLSDERVARLERLVEAFYGEAYDQGYRDGYDQGYRDPDFDQEEVWIR